MYHDPTLDILSWDLVTPTMMQMRTKKKAAFVPMSRSSCAIISAWTTSSARVEMDADLRAALGRGCIPMYCDTDSWMMLVRNGEDHGFKISPFYNDYKSEIPACMKVTSVFTIGPKNYCLRCAKEHDKSRGPEELCKECKEHERKGNYKDIMHVRGFSLKSRYVRDLLTPARVGSFARSVLTGEGKCVRVAQFALRTRRETRRIRTLYYVKRYRNNYPSKRVIIENSRFRLKQSLPYGFTQAMLNAALL